MNKFLWLAIAGGVIIAGIVGLRVWLPSVEDSTTSSYSDPSQQNAQDTSNLQTQQSNQVGSALPSTNIEIADQGKDVQPEIEHKDQEPQELDEKLDQVVQEYGKNLQYPMYSRPLTTNDKALLNPHQFSPVSQTLPDNRDINYEVVMPSYVLFHGTPIEVTFRIRATKNEKVPRVDSIQAEILDGKGKKGEIQMQKVSEDEKLITYQGSYTPAPSEAAKWGTQLTLKVSFEPSGYEEEILATTFQYAPVLASIQDVKSPKIQGANLVIPISLNTEKEGFYEVAGNLFSKKTGKPVAHLRDKAQIKGGSGVINLKVHANVLRKQQDEGPYELKNLWVYRLPDNLKDDEQFGATDDKSYLVEGFSLDQYSQEKYVNPDEEEKLNRLKKWIEKNKADS